MLPTSPTLQIPPTPPDVFPPAGWLRKKKAAERLERTEEAVSSMVRNRTIVFKKMMDPGIKQLVTLIHEGDVERIIHERKNPPQRVVNILNTPPIPPPNTPPIPTPLPPPTPQLALPAPEAPEAPNAPADAMPAARPPNWNPLCWPCWLTLPEAAEYSGMTKRWLLEQAERSVEVPRTSEQWVSGMDTIIRDMGKHSLGGRWRFHRESMEKA